MKVALLEEDGVDVDIIKIKNQANHCEGVVRGGRTVGGKGNDGG